MTGDFVRVPSWQQWPVSGLAAPKGDSSKSQGQSQDADERKEKDWNSCVKPRLPLQRVMNQVLVIFRVDPQKGKLNKLLSDPRCFSSPPLSSEQTEPTTPRQFTFWDQVETEIHDPVRLALSQKILRRQCRCVSLSYGAMKNTRFETLYAHLAQTADKHAVPRLPHLDSGVRYARHLAPVARALSPAALPFDATRRRAWHRIILSRALAYLIVLLAAGALCRIGPSAPLTLHRPPIQRQLSGRSMTVFCTLQNSSAACCASKQESTRGLAYVTGVGAALTPPTSKLFR
uniref:Uncharacterized protein n=1 Tax=Coccidioides posadasii RMSCC 3488 TaxID=454284 RepID=A0A0J6FKE4_COCPO|nr:hypothetical protein CPAG_06212 [Coccidioides posadasii RMSCC 3488]